MAKEPLKKQGRPENIDKVDISTLNKSLGGTSKEHAIQRLKRDAPEKTRQNGKDSVREKIPQQKGFC